MLVRVFGKSDGLLDRVSENEIFRFLSLRGISPKLIGETSWGRFEEFLINHKPLPGGMSMIEMGPDLDMVSLIAKQLVVLHASVKVTLASANVFDVMSKWMMLVEEKCCTVRPSPPFAPPTICVLRGEISWVKTTCMETVLGHPRIRTNAQCLSLYKIVLCHNDMLSGNLMLDQKNLRLIDFEYSGLNYAAADLANLLCAVCESILIAGDMQNVKENFPSQQVQLHLLEAYLQDPITDPEALLTVLAAFAMADELRWTLWNIIQEHQSEIPFDYCRCYNSRYNAYLDYKSMFTDKFNKLAD